MKTTLSLMSGLGKDGCLFKSVDIFPKFEYGNYIYQYSESKGRLAHCYVMHILALIGYKSHTVD